MANARGFHLRDAIIAVLITAVVLALAVVGLSRFRSSVTQQHDAVWVRSVWQGFDVWAQQNADMYPLPSLADAADSTIKAPPASKDTTANIFSMLVWEGHVSTEVLVSIAEVNPKIRPHQNYQIDQPSAAVDPSNALWDPSLSADFTSASGGHISFAHLQPAGERRSRWRRADKPLGVVVGNRGPEIASVTYDGSGGVPIWGYAKKQSLTYLIHGSRKSWEGNIVYSDGHVNFERSPVASDLLNITVGGVGGGGGVGGQRVRDVIFYDEPDGKAANAYLGLFIRSGKTPAEFEAIWD